MPCLQDFDRNSPKLYSCWERPRGWGDEVHVTGNARVHWRLALGAAQHAQAADLAVARPLLTPDSTWTGFYGGINLGGFAATGTAQWNPLPSPAAFGFNGTTTNLATDGVTVGIQAGYNLQLSPFFVTGIEGDITNDHTSQKTFSSWTTFGTNTGLAGSSVPEIRTLEWLGTLRGRFGYLLTPRTLVYATGGVAWSGVNYAGASTGPIGPGYASSVSFTETDRSATWSAAASSS